MWRGGRLATDKRHLGYTVLQSVPLQAATQPKRKGRGGKAEADVGHWYGVMPHNFGLGPVK